MNTASTILIIVAILVAMVLGVVLAVTISLYFASRQIKNRIDLLDEHLVFLINTIEDLDESSTNELNALHKSLDEQQKVHKSIAQSSRIFNLVFKKLTSSPFANRAKKRPISSCYSWGIKKNCFQ